MRVVSAHQLGFPLVLRLPGPTGLALLFPLACGSSRVNIWHLAGGSIGEPWCWGRISVFKNTNILTLLNLNKLHIGIHMFKTLNGHIQVLQSNHNYPTRSNQNLNVPLHTISLYQHSLSYTGPKLWNTIPQHFKTQPLKIVSKNIYYFYNRNCKLFYCT